MKQCLTVVLGIFLLCSVASAAETSEIKGEKDKINYSLGYQIGGDLKRRNIEFDPEFFVKGVRDALSGAEPSLSVEEMSKTLLELKRKITTAQLETRKEEAAKNLAEGKSFLAENAKKKGVETLPSGLQYKVIKKGSGPSPTTEGTVTVHYRGSLIDGTEFDSSYGRGKPATFRLDRVIKGWTEALQLMKEGAKWQIFIPANLAYGERGAGRQIPPNSALIFEIELISVQPAGQ